MSQCFCLNIWPTWRAYSVYIIFKFQIEAWVSELAQNQECHVIVFGHSNMYKIMNFGICWVSRNGLVSQGWISRNLHGGMHDLQENQNFRMDSVFRHCGGRVAAISNSNRFYPATHRIRNNRHTFLGPSLCVQQNRTCREPPARRQCSRHSPNFWCFAIRFAFQMQVLAYHAGFACFHVGMGQN